MKLWVELTLLFLYFLVPSAREIKQIGNKKWKKNQKLYSIISGRAGGQGDLNQSLFYQPDENSSLVYERFFNKLISIQKKKLVCTFGAHATRATHQVPH